MMKNKVSHTSSSASAGTVLQNPQVGDYVDVYNEKHKKWYPNVILGVSSEMGQQHIKVGDFKGKIHNVNIYETSVRPSKAPQPVQNLEFTDPKAGDYYFFDAVNKQVIFSSAETKVVAKHGSDLSDIISEAETVILPDQKQQNQSHAISSVKTSSSSSSVVPVIQSPKKGDYLELLWPEHDNTWFAGVILKSYSHNGKPYIKVGYFNEDFSTTDLYKYASRRIDKPLHGKDIKFTDKKNGDQYFYYHNTGQIDYKQAERVKQVPNKATSSAPTQLISTDAQLQAVSKQLEDTKKMMRELESMQIKLQAEKIKDEALSVMTFLKEDTATATDLAKCLSSLKAHKQETEKRYYDFTIDTLGIQHNNQLSEKEDILPAGFKQAVTDCVLSHKKLRDAIHVYLSDDLPAVSTPGLPIAPAYAAMQAKRSEPAPNDDNKRHKLGS